MLRWFLNSMMAAFSNSLLVVTTAALAAYPLARMEFRGKRIVFSGPFGFIGEPLEMVTTYDYEAVGDSTRVDVKVAGAGRLDAEWPALVDGAWKHFLFERLEPHVKVGAHLGS